MVVENQIVNPHGDACTRFINRVTGIGIITVFSPITALVEGVNAILHKAADGDSTCVCMECVDQRSNLSKRLTWSQKVENQ